MRNDYKIRPRLDFKKGGKAFPDLTGDGKVTFKDVLKGRGVVKKKGGMIKEGMHKMPSGKKMKNSAMKKNKK
jgi:hypothetical protein